MRLWNNLLLITACLLIAASSYMYFSGSEKTNKNNAVVLKMTCRTKGVELESCKKAAAEWSKSSGIKVEIVSLPHNSNECLTLTQQLLSSASSEVDVFQMDITWPAILESHLIDLHPHVSNEIISSHLPAIIANNTVNNKFVGLPWYTDVGVLYYRKDLLEKYNEQPPVTWDDLERISKKIQDSERQAGNSKMWGIVFLGRAFEGLTCNLVEWIDSYGGAILDENSNVIIDSAESKTALEKIANWVGNIAPEGVLNYAEEEARGVFQTGNAIFMRNWPYAWALLNKTGSVVANKVGITVLPKGTGPKAKNTGVLGGWSLGISKYSKHQKEAANLIIYLASKAEQKRRSIEASYSPTISSLYDDPEVLAANPFLKSIVPAFQNAVTRPASKAGKKYNQLSNELYNSVHVILSNKGKGIEEELKSLTNKLKELIKNSDKSS